MEIGFYDDHYIWQGGRHQRINGIWYRIENNIIVDRDQYRHDLESRATAKANGMANNIINPTAPQ